LFLRHLVSPEVADAFLRMLWGDVLNGRVLTQTHQQDLLRKNALEIHGRNYPPLLGLHWGLTSTIANKVSSDLLPSFAFFRLYFADDVCRVHSDRPACEVSVSLTLAYSDGEPWELCVARNEATDRVTIHEDFGNEPHETFAPLPGDGVLYYGSRHRHGRITPNPNRWSAHIFMHWVAREGAHRDQAFERLELGATPAF
jgi:hypothetical protein